LRRGYNRGEHFARLTVGGIWPGRICREIWPTNGQPSAQAWLDDEGTFNLQDACSLFHSASVAGLGGDLDHAVEHHGRTTNLSQASLERSLQHAEVRMAQGHCVPQIQPVAGLYVDTLISRPMSRPLLNKNGPMWKGPFAVRTTRSPGSRASSTQMEDARRPVFLCIV